MPAKLPDLLAQAADETQDGVARLYAAATLRAQLDEWLPVLAQNAREEGNSWAELGTALGVTRQATQKRFGNSDTPVSVWDATESEPTLRPPTSGELELVKAELQRMKAAGTLPADYDDAVLRRLDGSKPEHD